MVLRVAGGTWSQGMPEDQLCSGYSLLENSATMGSYLLVVL